MVGPGPFRFLDVITVASARKIAPPAAHPVTYHHETLGTKIRMKPTNHEMSPEMKNFSPRFNCGGSASARLVSRSEDGFFTDSFQALKSLVSPGDLRRRTDRTA